MNHICAVCRWCGSVGYIGWWPPVGLEWFAVAGMRISTSDVVLGRKKMECWLQVRERLLPQIEAFKYTGVLFMYEMRREVRDRRIGMAWWGESGAQMWSCRFAAWPASLMSPMVTSSGQWPKNEVELLLHVGRSHLGWFGHLSRMIPWPALGWGVLGITYWTEAPAQTGTPG